MTNLAITYRKVTETGYRSGRISKQQKEKLLVLMRSNRRTALGQFGGTNSAKTSQLVWQSVAEELNAAGGAFKTAEQWKKSWSDWKVSVKKQQAALLRFRNTTGNLPVSEGPPSLEGLDAEVLEFFPPAMVDGDTTTPEGHFTVCEKSEEEVIQMDLNDLLDTPKAAQKQPSNCVTPKVKTNQKPSYNSAFEDVKKLIVEQEQNRTAQIEEMISILKSIDASLKVLTNKADF